MIDNKYRVHEVAKDFGLATKDISQILTDYSAPPKNHMQVLETKELDIIFEYLTQHNQVASTEVFKVEPEEGRGQAGRASDPAKKDGGAQKPQSKSGQPQASGKGPGLPQNAQPSERRSRPQRARRRTNRTSLARWPRSAWSIPAAALSTLKNITRSLRIWPLRRLTPPRCATPAAAASAKVGNKAPPPAASERAAEQQAPSGRAR